MEDFCFAPLGYEEVMMKPFRLASSILAFNLAIGTPTLVFAHTGHGDEFQAEGGINRVQVNPETDPILGIQVTPIEPAADGSAAVLVPATALVDANGKQIVFVQYENFYEPVPVTTGATKGELIEVTQGLSVGEKLVSQGSLSLYAESRKTQTATASPSPAAIASPQADTAHAQADAQGVPHSHDAAGNLVQSSGTTPQSGGWSPARVAVIGGGAALLVGGIVLLVTSRKKKSIFSDKREGL
jgi:cation efflux system membrane fusion protein